MEGNVTEAASAASSVEEIQLNVARIMIQEFKLEDVTPENFDVEIDLVDEMGIDSMDMATLALVLQDEYKITIREDDYPNLGTVRLIAQYILSRLG